MTEVQPSEEIHVPKPFVWTAVLYLALAEGLFYFFGSPESVVAGMKWIFFLWIISAIDLFALAKSVIAIMKLMSENDNERKGALIFQAFFWGTGKLVFLGLLGLVIFKARLAPEFALILGIGTLVVVPIFGGFWWSQRTLRHA